MLFLYPRDDIRQKVQDIVEAANGDEIDGFYEQISAIFEGKNGCSALMALCVALAGIRTLSVQRGQDEDVANAVMLTLLGHVLDCTRDEPEPGSLLQ
jgi:hypothetical protein